jgi:formaldehyde dismutase / methanol dehydrogenase
MDRKLFEFPISYTTLIGKIGLGWGAHETVADECQTAGIKKALIATSGLNGTGIVDEIQGILHHRGIATEIYDKVTSNPKDFEVEEAFAIFQQAQCNGVVSIGGGSSHDCGKGVRALAANSDKKIGDMAAFLDPPWMEKMKTYHPITVPQISVNTTAGTGAESTMAAVIINSRDRIKQVIMVPGLAPTAALIDPLLIRMMPRNLAAQTGFDALAHAFECYITRLPSRYSRYLMLGSMSLVSQSLREFAYNRMNSKACEDMCWAESMSGLGLSHGGGVGIVHGFSHGISTLYNVHHGLASAAVAVPLERYNAECCPEKFADMARAMGVDTRGMTTGQAADRWFEEIERLLKDLDIQTGNLKKQFGVKEEDLEHIILKQYKNDFNREGNPRDYNFEECLRLFKSLL